MDANVDTRIVDMQFENQEFERNISKSQKSLERFKKELNFDEASRGIERFSSAMSDTSAFDKLASNMDKLVDHFTGVGSIGDYAARKIRSAWEGATDALLRFTDSLTKAQVSVGFAKYETLNKSVQTLKSATDKDEAEIYSILDRLNTYTDQTSYDFSQGVTSISQLVSSGAATLEQAEVTVEGFYNYAAKAGADVEKASQALNYSMVQAFQRGYLDWSNAKELSNRSMLTADFKETLIETAVALGKVTKREGKYYAISHKSAEEKEIELNATDLFNDSLQYQWATTEVLNATLTKYADTTTEFGAQAYAAAQRCTTFSDALNAWKDMLSTGWMHTYRTVFGDLGEAMQLFSGICDKVADKLSVLSDARNEVLRTWRESGGADDLWSLLIGEFESPDEGIKFEGVYGLLDFISDIGSIISEAFMDSLNPNDPSIDWSDKEERLKYLASVLTFYTKQIKDSVQELNEFLSEVNPETGVTRFEQLQNIMAAVFNTIKFIISIVGNVISFFGNIVEKFQPSIDAFINLLSELALVVKDEENKLIQGHGIFDFFNNLLEAMSPVIDFLNGTVTEILNFFTGLVKSSSDAEKASDRIGRSTSGWKELKDFFQGLADILDTIITPLKDGLKNIFDAITNGLNKTGKRSKDGKKTFSFFQLLLNILTPLANLLGGIIGLVTDAITEFIIWGNESGTFSTIWETIATVLSSVKNKLVGLGSVFSDFFGRIRQPVSEIFSKGITKDTLLDLWNEIKLAFSSLFSDLGNLFPELKAKVKSFYEKIVKLFKGEAVSTGVGSEKGGFFQGILSNAKESIANLFGGLNNLLPGVGESVKNFFGNLFGILKKEETTALPEGGKRSFKFDPSMIIASAGMSDVSFLHKPVSELKDASEELSETGKDIEETKNNIVSFGETIVKTIGGLFSQIKEFFGTDNDFEAIVTLILGFMAIRTVYLVTKKAVSTLKGIGNGIKTITETIQQSYKDAAQTESKGDKILKIASAIGILAAAVFALGKMELWQAVQGIGALLVIMVLLGAFMHFVNKEFTKKKNDDSVLNAKGFILPLLGLAISLSKIIAAMKPIMDMKVEDDAWGRMGRMLLSLFGILGIIGGFLTITNRFSGGVKIGTFLSILSIAWVLNSIINAIVRFTDLKLDPERSETLNVAYDMVTQLLGLMALVGFAGKGGTIKDVGFLLAGVGVLMWAMKDFSTLYGDEHMWEKIALIFGTMVATLSIVFVFSKLMSKFGASMKNTGMDQFLLMVVGIAILMRVLKSVLSVYDDDNKAWEKWGMMMATLVVVLGSIWGFAALMGKHTMSGSGFGNIIVIAIGIWAIITALKSVINLSKTQLIKMFATLAVILGGILGFVAGVRYVEKEFDKGGMKKSFSFGTILAMVIGISALIRALKPLAKMEWTELGKIGASFVVVILGLTKAVSTIQSSENGFWAAIGSLAIILAFTHAVKQILYSITKFASLDKIKYDKAIVSLFAILRELGDSISKIEVNSGTFGSSIGSVLMILAFTRAVNKITQEMKGLSVYSGSDLRRSRKFFKTIAEAMSTAISEIGSIKFDSIYKVLGGVLYMYAFATSVGILFTVLEPLADMSLVGVIKVCYGLSQLIKGIQKVTYDLGDLANSINSWKQVVGIFAVLAGIGGVVLAFGFAMKLAKDVPLGNVVAFGILIKQLIQVVPSEVKPILGKGREIAGGIFGMLTVYAGLAGAMIAFGYSVSLIKDTSIAKILVFGLMLKAIISVMPTEVKPITGTFREIAGGIIGMLAEYAGLAGVMLAFAKSVSMIKESSIVSMIVFSLMLKMLLNQLVTTMSGLPKLKHGDALSAVSPFIGLAIAMVAFGAALKMSKGMKTSSILAFAGGLSVMMLVMGKLAKDLQHVNVVEIAKIMGVMALGMAAIVAAILLVIGLMGGWVLEQLGNALPQFSEAFSAFGESMGAFSKSVGDVGNTDFSNVFELLKSMVEIQAMLTGENIVVGIFERLTGRDIDAGNLAAFGQDLSTIGGFISEFANSVKDADFKNVNKATEALETMAVVKTILMGNDIGTALLEWFKDLTGVQVQHTSLTSFADDIVEIVPQLVSIGNALKDVTFTNFSKAAEGLKAIGELNSSITSDSIKLDIFGMLAGVGIQESRLQNFCKDLVAATPLIAQAGAGLEGVNTDGFTKAAEAMNAMNQISTRIGIKEIALSFLTKLLPVGITDEGASLSKFCKDISIAAPMLQSASSNLTGVNTEAFGNVANALEALSEFTITMQGKQILLEVISKFTGIGLTKASLVNFCEDIKTAFPIFKDAAKLIGNFDNVDSFTNVADALAAMFTVQSALTGQEIKRKVWSAITGFDIDKGNLEDFVNDIVAAAPKLNELSSAMEGCNFDNVKLAGDAMKEFAELQKTLTDEKIAVAWTNFLTNPLGLFGEKGNIETGDIEQFATKLYPLGVALSDFANAVAYVHDQNGNVIEPVDREAFETATKAIEAITALQMAVPPVDSLGFGDLTSFSGGLYTLADGIRGLYAGVYSVENETGVDSSLEGFGHVADMVNGLAIIASMIDTGKEIDFNNIDATGLVEALNDLIAVDTEENANSITRIGSFLESISNAQNVLNGTAATKTGTIKAFGNFLDSIAEFTNYSYDSFKGIGTSIAVAVASGVDEDRTIGKKVQTAISGLIGSPIAFLRDLLSPDEITGLFSDDNSVVKIGTLIADSIATGVKNETTSVKDAIEALIAIPAGNLASLVAPSVENNIFRIIGGNIVESLVAGISSKLSTTENSMDSITETLKGELISLAMIMNDTIDGTIDVSPTISPVLDLTNFSAGVASMKQQMAGISLAPNSYGLRTTIGGIEVTSKTDLSGVHSRIDALNASVNNLSTKVSNMRIYLDNRTLIGGVSAGVGSAINRKEFFDSRRN